MRFSITILTLFVFFSDAFGQDPDYTLARAGEKINGVYIFVGCEPANSYQYVASIDAKVDWYGNRVGSLQDIIKKANKKYSSFNAIIFRYRDFKTAELIRFDDLKVSRGGIALRSKVSFIQGRQVYYGEVVELGTAKQGSEKEKGMVRYLNLLDEEKVVKLKYTDMTPMTEEEFEVKREAFVRDEVSKYKYEVGEKVSWRSLGKDYYGEVVKLNSETHKASMNYLNEYGETKIGTAGYLEMVKVSDESYAEMLAKQKEEIAKYKFNVGDKVSFVKGLGNKKEQITGEIVELDDSSHKASVKYTDSQGEEKIAKVNYLELTRAE